MPAPRAGATSTALRSDASQNRTARSAAALGVGSATNGSGASSSRAALPLDRPCLHCSKQYNHRDLRCPHCTYFNDLALPMNVDPALPAAAVARTSEAPAAAATVPTPATSAESMAVSSPVSTSIADGVDVDDHDDDAGTADMSLASLAQMQESLNHLLAFLEQEPSPLRLAAFGPTVAALRNVAFTTEYRVGFLGLSNIGKSFLLNALLAITAHDPMEYHHSYFRRGHAALEYIATLRRLGRLPGQQLQTIKLADVLQRPPATSAAPAATSATAASSPSLATHDALCTAARASIAAFQHGVQTAYSGRAMSPPALANFSKDSAWLLPSGTSGGPTTSFVIRVHYGRTFHMVVQYKSEESMRDIALEWAEHLRENVKPRSSFLRQQWKCFVGTSPDAAAKITDAATIVLTDQARALAGRQQLYMGLGHDRVPAQGMATFDLDRQWLHQTLRNIVTAELHSFAIDTVDIFVPCHLLQSGCELLDIPGCGDPHLQEMVREQVQECHQLFVVTQQSPERNETMSTSIRDSGFLQNLLRNDPTRSMELHVLGYFERHKGARSLSEQPDVHTDRTRDVEQLRMDTHEWLENEFGLHAAQQLRARVPLYDVEPVSFLALLRNEGARSTDDSPATSASTTATASSAAALSSSSRSMSFHDKCTRTNMLRLISTVRSVPWRRAQQALKVLVQDPRGTIAVASAEKVAAAAASSHGLSSPSDSQTADAGGGGGGGDGDGDGAIATGLLPRLLQLLEDELDGASSDRQEDLDVLAREAKRLSRPHSQELRSLLSNAADDAQVSTARTSWDEQLAAAIQAMLLDPEVGFEKAVLDATVAGREAFRRAEHHLRNENIPVSLGPRHRGNRPPLRLRQLLFGYFAEYPLDGAAIIKVMRNHMQAFLQQDTAERQQRVMKHVLQQILAGVNRPELQHNGALQRAMERALASSEATVAAGVAAVFSGQLTPERVFDLFARAHGTTLFEWLTRNFARLREMPIAEVRQSVYDAVPSIIERLGVKVTDQICVVTKARFKTLFWMLWDQNKTKSMVRQSAVNLLQEMVLLGSEDGGGSSGAAPASSMATTAQSSANPRRACIESMLEWLRAWETQAQAMGRQDASDVEHDALSSIILSSSRFAALMETLVKKRKGVGVHVHRARRALHMRWPRLPRSGFFESWNQAGSRSPKERLRQVLKAIISTAPSINAVRTEQQWQCLQHIRGWNWDSPFVRGLRSSAFGRTLMRNWHLFMVDVPGDGDCLFTAVAHQLRWSDGSANKPLTSLDDLALNPRTLRELAVETLRVLYRDDPNFAVKFGHSVDEYAQHMLRDGSWGGEPELVALAHVLQVQILLWVPGAERPMLFSPAHDEAGVLPIMQLALVHGCGVAAAHGQQLNHFVSLVPAMQPGVTFAGARAPLLQPQAEL